MATALGDDSRVHTPPLEAFIQVCEGLDRDLQPCLSPSFALITPRCDGAFDGLQGQERRAMHDLLARPTP